MEENQESQVLNPEPEVRSPDVGFPMSQPKQKSSFPLWVVVVIILLILIGGGIFIFTKKSNEEGGEIPTPEATVFESTPEPAATPAAIDKGKVKIEVQNGSGISGEAAYLQGQLKNLGYSDIKVGNSSSQDNETTMVNFNKTLSSQIVGEITKKLESIYKAVESKTSSTLEKDILVVTGLRKGQTPRPAATATPRPSGTPRPTSSSTPSSSPSPSPTSTP